MDRKTEAWLVDYVIRKQDGELQYGSATFAALDLFAAVEKAKDLVDDYARQNPEDEARVWNVGLVAEFGPEELFEVE